MLSGSNPSVSPSSNTVLENTRPQLPAEVIDLVVDEIAATSNQEASLHELLALAQASRRLCMRAYRHLFSELHLTVAHNFGNEKDSGSLYNIHGVLERLHNTLIHGLEFPGLAMVYHLQTVRISIKFNSWEDLSDILSLSLLPETLRLLHGPNHGITCFGFEIDTTTLPDEMPVPPIQSSEALNHRFSQELCTLFHSPYLKTLYLRHVVVPSTIFHGTRIENIHLREVTFEDYPEGVASRDHNNSDLKSGSVTQPTALTLVCTIHIRSLSDMTDTTLLDITNSSGMSGSATNPWDSNSMYRFGVEEYDLVGFFHPSHRATTSLSHQEVFSCLTRLTLMDFDCNHIRLDFLPHLHSLKIIQSLFLPCISNFGYSTLHSFFEPNPGVARSLGSIKSLTVETDVVYSKMFIYDRGQDENAIFIPQLKPTRGSWRIVDLHASSTLGKLERVNFMFKFLLMSNEMLAPGYNDWDAFIAASKKIIAGYFPRLSVLSSFSLDAVIKREENPTTVTRVHFSKALI